MRNLKKFLALVLAFMMAMSLMVTVNASNLDKVDGGDEVTTQFAEAVDVLVGMGIVKGIGNDDGSVTLDAKKSVTRAEVAGWIYRLYTGDVNDTQIHLYDGYSAKFSDVPAGQWYSGYVGFCENKGFIAGAGGKFEPLREITGFEALVMVERAMGYDRCGELTGNGEWQSQASIFASGRGLLVNVNNSSYQAGLSKIATRELVMEMVFQAATHSMVTNNTLLTNRYEDMNPENGIANQSLGEWRFGLTSNVGVIVGNQATGETDTLIGFEVAIQGRDDMFTSDGGTTWTAGVGDGEYDVITSGVITDTVTQRDDGAGNGLPSAYIYETSNASADPTNPLTFDYSADDLVKNGANVTLSFVDNEDVEELETAQTDLGLFNHKVKVWYDNRSSDVAEIQAVNTANAVSRINFPDGLTTYTIIDKSVTFKVLSDWESGNLGSTGADISSYTADDKTLGEVAAKAGFFAPSTTGTSAYYNYAFSPMDNTCLATGITYAASRASSESPVKKNDKSDAYPMYLVISNSYGPGNKPNVDVVISLDMTITQLWEDNRYQSTTSFGVLNGNDSTDTGATKGDNVATKSYFGGATGLAAPWSDNSVSVVDTLNGDNRTYLNIPRAHVTNDTSDLKLRDPVAVVAIAGTRTGSVLTTFDQANGTARPTSTTGIQKYDLSANKSYYQIVKLTERVVGTVLYIAPNQDVTIQMDDGSTKVLPKSVFAESTDGSFAWDLNPTRGVNNVQPKDRYYFYVDGDGNYLFYEKDPSAATKFVYGTYMDWQTGFISAEFQYGLEFVDGSGNPDNDVVKKIDTNTIGSSGNEYYSVPLPKREDNSATWSSSNTVSGVYVGYQLGEDHNLRTITSIDNPTGFVQATKDNFGNDTFTISSNDVTVGAKEIGTGNSKLALTKDTKFYLVRGTGANTVTVTQTSYAEMQGRLVDVKDVANNSGDGAFIGSTASQHNLLDKANGGDELWKMVYYSIDTSGNYAQIVQTGARPVDTVFIPEACVKAATSASTGSKLVFVGVGAKSIDKENSYANSDLNYQATMFKVYDATTGAEEHLWIRGYRNSVTDNDSSGWNDSAMVAANSNMFMRLVPTGQKANDDGIIYKLDDLTAAASGSQNNYDVGRVVGKYWDETGGTIANSSNHAGNYGTVTNKGRFIPAYFGDYTYGYIWDDTQDGSGAGEHLVNIASATVVNLVDKNALNVSNVTEFVNAASVDINKGVDDVSYYLKSTGSSSSTVQVVFINEQP